MYVVGGQRSDQFKATGLGFVAPDNSVADSFDAFVSTRDINQAIDGIKTFSSHPRIDIYTAPSADVQYVPKKYVDDSISGTGPGLFVDESGDTMSGDLDMDGNRILNVSTLTFSGSAIQGVGEIVFKDATTMTSASQFAVAAGTGGIADNSDLLDGLDSTDFLQISGGTMNGNIDMNANRLYYDQANGSYSIYDRANNWLRFYKGLVEFMRFEN